MKKAAETLEGLSKGMDWVITRLVFMLIISMVIVTTLQIIFRVFFTALVWSEELSRYLLVWSTFFAATMAYRRGNHIAITVFINFFKPKVKALFNILIYLLSMVFFAIIIRYGWQIIQMQIFQISPAMSLPMKYVYLSIPLSLLVMMLHAIAGTAREIGVFLGVMD
ncbi:MAG: TRAP transporter small permease [Bacillota bacterium]